MERINGWHRFSGATVKHPGMVLVTPFVQMIWSEWCDPLLTSLFNSPDFFLRFFFSCSSSPSRRKMVSKAIGRIIAGAFGVVKQKTEKNEKKTDFFLFHVKGS